MDTENRVRVEISAEAAKAKAQIKELFEQVDAGKKVVAGLNSTWTQTANATEQAIRQQTAAIKAQAREVLTSSQRFKQEVANALAASDAFYGKHVFAQTAEAIQQARQRLALPIATGMGVPVAELAKNVKVVNADIASMAVRARAAVDSVTSLGQAMTAYVGVSTMRGFIDEAIKGRTAVAQLDSAMKSAGNGSESFRASLDRQAKTLSKVTAYDDDAITSVQARLVTMGVQNDVLQMATELTLDLAVAQGTDAVSAAQRLGNALRGEAIEPLRGLRTEIDKTLPKEEQQRKFLGDLNKAVGGRAKSTFLSTAPDYIGLLKEMTEVSKAFGEAILSTDIPRQLKEVAEAIKNTSSYTKTFAMEAAGLAAGLLGVRAALQFAVIPAVSSTVSVVTRATSAFVAWTAATAAAGGSLGTGLVVGGGITAGIVAATLTLQRAIQWMRAEEEARKSAREARDQDAQTWNALNDAITGAGSAGEITLQQMRDLHGVIRVASRDYTEGLITQRTYLETLLRYGRQLEQIRVKQAQAKPQPQNNDAEVAAYVRALSEMTKAQLETEKQGLEQQYAQRTISDQAYFARRREIAQTENRAELEDLLAQQASIQDRINKINADTSKPQFQRRREAEEESLKLIDLQAKSYVASQKLQREQMKIDQEAAQRASENARTQLEIQTRTFESRRQGIDLADQELSANWWMTDGEKRQPHLDLLQRQIDLDREEIQVLTEQAAKLVEGTELRRTYDDQILQANDRLRQDQSKLQIAQDQPDPGTFSGTLMVKIAQLRAEWSNMAVNMANILTNTVTSAVQGLSSAIASVAVGTMNAAEAFRQFAVQMVTSFIASVLQMVLTAKVAIPVLTALGVLSGGSIPAAGSVATIASVGAAVAATSAYADGGLVRGPGGPRDDRIWARLSDREFVQNARAVAYYGPDIMAAMNALAIPRSAFERFSLGYKPARSFGLADGGMVAGSGRESGAQVNLAIYDRADQAEEFLRSARGQKMLVETIRRNAGAIGFRRS